MMIISIESENFFYKKGLEFLIRESLPEDALRDCVFITDNENEIEMVNIILRDTSISINFFKKKNNINELVPSKNKSTLHIPFSSKNRKITDIKWVIEKVVFIASLNLEDFVNDNFYRMTGLKKHEQLSLTETKIMLSIGKGNDVNIISSQLNRSEKTINVHCRNASRKMKISNKVDFYNYAKFIINCRRNERKILCL